jgi:hypothetical protein
MTTTTTPTPTRFFTIATTIVLSCLVTPTHAWNGPQVIANQVIAFAAATTTATSRLSSTTMMNSNNAAVNMSGSYADPNHPNCKRIIEVVDDTVATLTGTDGNPGCPPDGSGDPWTLTGIVEGGNSIFVDFTPKGGPKDLKGVFDGTGIEWPDGNKWMLKEE